MQSSFTYIGNKPKKGQTNPTEVKKAEGISAHRVGHPSLSEVDDPPGGDFLSLLSWKRHVGNVSSGTFAVKDLTGQNR